MKSANNKISSFLRSVSYSLSANLLSLLISTMTVLLVPKFMGTEAYGYYHLYLFYVSYVGVLYFGLCDGIYLRNGGRYYDQLEKPLYCSQFWLLGAFETLVYLAIYLAAAHFSNDGGKLYVIGCTCVVAVAMCLRWFITFVLQATARIKEYAIVTSTEKVLFFAFIFIYVLAGHRRFQALICANVVAVYISLGVGVWYCRDIVFSRLEKWSTVISEAKENVSAGIKLMLSLLCGMLIIGVIRFGVETRWDISTFGKVSLTLSISNMVLSAVNAVSVVIYPLLRRIERERWLTIYSVIRVGLMGLVFGVLVFYYPMKRILSVWLPQYAESLRYVAILFPVCVYESKMSILINTFYNTLRLETLLMKCNMASLALSVVCTIISTRILNSVTAAILSILFVLIFRCVVSELLLSKKLRAQVTQDIILEMLMSLVFIICNWYFGFVGMVVYALFYISYLFIKWKDIGLSISFIKSMR